MTRDPSAPGGTVPLDHVCVVMMSAVGDVVHVLPVLHAIKRVAPAARITWVLQSGPAALVRGHPLVDEIVLFDRSAGVRGFLDVRRARDMNWLFTTHRIPPHPMQHVQDQYFEFSDWLGAPSAPVTWGLAPWNDEERAWQRDFTKGFDRPIAPIVVATSKADKDWLPERWAEVCDALWSDFGMHPVLVGGRSPRELAAEHTILARARHKPATALGSGLRRLVAILDSAALVLSPDTGPLHMAVALGRPVVALVGFSNPKRVGPYRAYRDLMIDAYGEPDEDYPVSMENRTGRMPRISVRDVLDRVERWRARYRDPAGRA